MSTADLPGNAETLRKQIRSMIPEVIEEPQSATATVLSEDSDGNKEYVGELLGHRVSALVRQLPIGAVGVTYSLYL